MLKNPHWLGADHVQVEQIQWAMVNGAEAMAMYGRGALDVVVPPQTELERIQAGAALSQELVIQPSLCTVAVAFYATKVPFLRTEAR